MRVCVAFGMFGIAAAMDMKRRHVDDRLWMAFGAVAAVLYFFDFARMDIPIVALSMGLGGAASYLLYRTGLFGGADALALAVFAAILPSYDGRLVLEGISAKEAHSLSPLALLSNAAVLSFAHLVINIVKNARYRARHPSALFAGMEGETAARKALAVMLGHHSNGSGFAFLMEKNCGGVRKFDFSLKPAEDTPFESRVGVWVMPGIPFLVYMLAGLVAMVFIGDLARVFLSAFAGAF
ncbi:A24 family peptidase C-terminal domain-containing protein [Nitrososphaera viennensis]|uniref:Prepilin peptidase n=1 Tax=Nitrososphaera viennensis TaxID=1034015 RepID=A0A977IFM7_9ARCH|nr:A24 family peptidase C-terminal domain-containing protein [Nitrososphaera viennensis]UVS70149.1 prepilin peptidase [Nitrososphaera viennensis]